MSRKDHTRRSVLKSSAALAGLTGVSGLATADKPDERPGKKQTDSVGGRAEVPDVGIKDESALRDGDVTIQSPVRENLEYLDHWKETDTLTATLDISDVEWLLTAYEAIDDDGTALTDSDGNYYYVLEYYVVSDEYSHLGSKGATTQLELGAELHSDNVAESRDPATTHAVNGQWLTIQQGFSAKGVSVTDTHEQWVDHGDYGPLYWTPGYGGEYGVMFDGDTPGGGQWDIIGLSTTTVPDKAYGVGYLVDYWEWYAKGYLKTI